MVSDLKAAVIGLGFMGGTHIEALRRLGVTVLGCLGSTPEETQGGAQTYGLPHAYESLEALLADPEVEVVHICTPNYLHYEMVKAALEHDKHVICEKPLAITSAQSAELVRLVRSRGLVGAVNYNLRFYPLNHEARSRVQAGALGDVRLVHGQYLQDWLLYPTDWNWRLEPDKGGVLRAVGDIGTHWFDLVTWITGLKIEAVMADMATIVPTRYRPAQAVETFANKLATADETEPVTVATEDYASILLRFSNGARGVVTVSQVSAGHKNRLRWEINGTDASLAWQQEDPNALWIGHRKEPNQQVVKDPSLMQAEARPVAGYPGGHAEGYPDTFKQLFKAVYGYIAQGDYSAPTSFATFEDGHHEMVLCDAILQSAQTGQWVTVEAGDV
ncbi:MAG: Gfo/Idh/MocA family oxidoreductase [Anaerolineae bacterium]